MQKEACGFGAVGVINRVAKDRGAKMGEMDAELVGAASLGF